MTDNAKPLTAEELIETERRYGSCAVPGSLGVLIRRLCSTISMARSALPMEGVVTDAMVERACLGCKEIYHDDQGRRITRFVAPDFVRAVLEAALSPSPSKPDDTAMGSDCAHEAFSVDALGQTTRCVDCGAPISDTPPSPAGNLELLEAAKAALKALDTEAEGAAKINSLTPTAARWEPSKAMRDRLRTAITHAGETGR